MKVYVIQSKKRIMLNLTANVKKSDGWTSYRDDYMWNPSTCKCECNKAWKIDEYLDTKNSSGKKRLFGKLVLVCEDDIVNTTETSLVEKK